MERLTIKATWSEDDEPTFVTTTALDPNDIQEINNYIGGTYFHGEEHSDDLEKAMKALERVNHALSFEPRAE